MFYNPRILQKLAFSPFTQDAQMMAQAQGGQPPMDPAMAQGGAPMPPQGGAPAPIQVVQGPNGEPVDPNTGFIVLDPQQGLEQEPLTGIIINVFTQEFMTPDGQPMDPNQAMQMIEQAMMQAQQQGGAMPMDPAMAQGGAPMPPQGGAPASQQGAGQTFDPATGQMIDDATGMMVDPSTGMLIDPTTGQMIDPNTGAMAPGAQQMPMFDDPEVMEQVKTALKELPSIVKNVAQIGKQQNAERTDIQGLRREIQALEDKQDAFLNRVDNAVALIEQLMGSPRQ
jgi:hypothetical protein